MVIVQENQQISNYKNIENIEMEEDLKENINMMIIE
jgi:hypothetical protein